jgi:SAM-dependent methyltransferase
MKNHESKLTAHQPLPDRAAAVALGLENYRAFVGPEHQYDFMGATQFRLLTTLGLRENHYLLDFGCGSLRAGRLFIPYLQPGHYFGLDPNKWAIEDGIENEIGRDIIKIKKPSFRHDTDFRASHFGTTFDFIVAQSIFSHAGSDIIKTALSDFRHCLKADGIILATFIYSDPLGTIAEFEGSGWIYPGCVAYKNTTIMNFVAQCGLIGRAIPWFHPRQTWFAIAHSSKYLPSPDDDTMLQGRILRTPPITA